MAPRQAQSIKPRSGSATPSRQGTPARRWFRIGPGLLLAVVVSVWVWRQAPPQAGGASSPGIERTRRESRASQNGTALRLSAPDPDWLVAQDSTLGLSKMQSARLRSLHLRWQRDTQALRENVAQATAQFERETAAAGSGGTSGVLSGVTLETLQERARPLSDLSRQLAAARRAWWEEASGLFTLDQRQKAEQAWAGRFARPAAVQRKDGNTAQTRP